MREWLVIPIITGISAGVGFGIGSYSGAGEFTFYGLIIGGISYGIYRVMKRGERN